MVPVKGKGGTQSDLRLPKRHMALEELPASIRDVIEFVGKTVRPNAVVLFGSRARGKFRENSDFDIAVAGKSCSEQEWTDMLLTLEEEPLTLYQVDLVELERLGPDYLDAIAAEGAIIDG